jgi:uncharacterized protein involved in exopolysaccharide biosynthesis
LQAERERLVAQYTPDHPQVVAIENQLRKLQAQLASMVNQRTESASQSNPIYEAVKTDLIRASAERDAYKARLADVNKKSLEHQQKLIDLNEAEVIADQLQRDIDVERRHLDIYIQKQGESDVLNRLDQQSISDVVIAQPASLMLKHVTPRGSLVLPLGLVMALATAVLVALYCERNYLSTALSEEEVEQFLDLPVLVTLPRATSSRNMVK